MRPALNPFDAKNTAELVEAVRAELSGCEPVAVDLAALSDKLNNLAGAVRVEKLITDRHGLGRQMAALRSVLGPAKRLAAALHAMPQGVQHPDGFEAETGGPDEPQWRLVARAINSRLAQRPREIDERLAHLPWLMSELVHILEAEIKDREHRGWGRGALIPGAASPLALAIKFDLPPIYRKAFGVPAELRYRRGDNACGPYVTFCQRFAKTAGYPRCGASMVRDAFRLPDETPRLQLWAENSETNVDH